jgi:heme exporter protein A
VAAAAGLEAQDLELWRGDRRLFTGLSLAVAPRRLLHVRGANGAGKTSLLRVLCGATPPDEGRVLWNGVAIDQQRLQYHAALAYLGHRDGLKLDLTATENLRFVLSLRTTVPDAGIQETLGQLGLAAASGLPVRALSAGQRRRVAIARCLLSEAPLWILDEPFSNLDAEGRAWGHACLERHLDRQGMIVITSHHPVKVPAHAMSALEL